MENQVFIEELKKYREASPSKNTNIWAGTKVLDMIYYLEAARARGFNVSPDKYYVFVKDRGQVFQCDSPEDAVDKAVEYSAFDYDSIEIGDYVDFGTYGCFYVCGENIDGTKFLVTWDSSKRAKRAEEGFYLEKSLAVDIVERYN